MPAVLCCSMLCWLAHWCNGRARRSGSTRSPNATRMAAWIACYLRPDASASHLHHPNHARRAAAWAPRRTTFTCT